MAPSKKHTVNSGYYSPLDHEDDDVIDHDSECDIDNDNERANEISKLPPVTILSKTCDFVHTLCKSGEIKNYCLKKISIGVKVFCDSLNTYEKLIALLKECDCQFFSHEKKVNKPFKVVLRGLDDETAESVKLELTIKGFVCTEVKRIIKTYDHGSASLYIISFVKGSVKLAELRSKCRALFHTIVKWDFHKKSKDSLVQCRNCQMFGHGEKFCNIKPKCLNCGRNHKSADCKMPESANVCANCKGGHKSNDPKCPSRASYTQLREQLKWRYRKSSHVISSGYTSNSCDFPTINTRATGSFLNSTANVNHLVNNRSSQQENMSATRPNLSYANATTNMTRVEDHELFSPQQILDLTMTMMTQLQTCKTKQQQFNVITQLVVKSIRNKQIEFFDMLVNKMIDVCILTETWLSEKDKLQHSHYNITRRDRSECQGGGVAILIRNDIAYSVLTLPKLHIIESIAITIHSNSCPINLAAVYFPGGYQNSANKLEFKNDLKKLFSLSDKFIICGDLNARHSLWNCTRANYWGNTLASLSTFYPISIMFPSKHTYIPASKTGSPSTLDLILTNCPDILSQPVALNALGSDHLPIVVYVSKQFQVNRPKRLNFNKANWAIYRSHITKNLPSVSSFTCPTSIHDVDYLVNILHTTINEAIQKAVPKTNKHQFHLRLPRYILDLIRLRNNYRREWSNYRQPFDKYMLNSLSNKIHSEISKFRNISWNNKLSDLAKGSRPFWNISKILKRKNYSSYPLVVNGSPVSSDSEKANVIASSFLSNHHVSNGLGSPINNDAVDALCARLETITTQIPSSSFFSDKEVKDFIKSLVIRKACGPDNIRNICLKMLPAKAISFLSFLFNSCLKLSYFPSLWKEAKVLPLLKPGKPANSPNSYRPISLLCSLGKIFEKLLQLRIVTFTESNNIIPKEQFGFRKFHNTTHQVKRICQHVKEHLSVGESTALVLLDVEKAFDSLWHNGLIYKLSQFGFPVYLIKIIRSFLNNRTFSVFLNGTKSDTFPIPAGVPQGSVLGPVLYTIFCSDFPTLSVCNSAFFADDTALYVSNVYGQSALNYLQHDLNVVSNYCQLWKIKLNANKTQAIFFTRRRKSTFLPSSNIVINGNRVVWSSNVKYLGVILDKKLTFSDHINHLINKSSLLIKILYPLINRKSSLSSENKLLIAKVVFQPLLLYACQAWKTCAKTHLKRLQIFQNKLLKMMLNLPWHYSTYQLHNLNNIKMLHDKILILYNNFQVNCSLSENELIRNLKF